MSLADQTKRDTALRAGGSAGALVCLSLLAGCAGSASNTPTASRSTLPASPAAVATPTHNAPVAAADADAIVAGKPIAKSSLQHWVSIEKALGQSLSARHQALGFLITSEWVLREAATLHITVSETEVRRRFDDIVHKSFPKPGSLQKFFASSGESEADVLARIEVEMLAEKIAAHVTAGKQGSQRAAALRAFEKRFQERWRRLTSCKAGFVMEDCKQYKGAPEKLAASSSQGTATRKASEAATSGEVYGTPGAFSISSPDFERNEQIPAQYTCAGQGISPPLTWEKVPSGAAELFLFVIDLNSSNSSGGQRWVVGGIDPSSKGVEAGKLPTGAIVGVNTAGQATYSPICPPKGKSDTIEFVMYALKKKIKLSQGFQPTEAESQYGSHNLIDGPAAVTYGIASR